MMLVMLVLVVMLVTTMTIKNTHTQWIEYLYIVLSMTTNILYDDDDDDDDDDSRFWVRLFIYRCLFCFYFRLDI